MKPLSQRLTNRELIQRGDLTLAFRAHDTVLDRPVFVKCLHPALAQDQEIRARFEREAKAVARLDHPNLVRIYEYGEDPEEGLFMLLEWLDGVTLGVRITGGERFAGEEFTDLASQLLRGLSALHGVGILHRDLKPENILVRERGGNQYKITDFSLAALRDAPKLTHHEAIVGTPAYMSPEQAAGGGPDERSDLYSLGVVLYEAATGENPFAGKTMLETLRNTRDLEPSFTHSAMVALPEKARDLLFKLLRKNPDVRPASAQEAREMLGGQAEEEPAPANPARRLFRYLPLLAILLGLWLVRRFVSSSPIPNYLLLLAVVIAFFIARSPLRHAQPEHIRPRNRKRDLTYLSVAALLIAFWVAMMLWHPWAKDEGGRMRDELSGAVLRPSDSVSSPLVPDTTATQTKNPKSQVPNPKTGTELSEPELRAAPKTKNDGAKLRDDNAKIVPSGPQISAAPAVPDTVNLLLTTEPWAQIFLNGVHVGTTPLSGPLRVPGGSQTLVLRNPAFPPVQVTLNLAEATSRAAVRLAQYTALVRVNVEPWGELFLDGEHTGTTPLPQPLFVSPGHHSVRVSHPQLAAVQQEFQAAAGETLAVNVDLVHGQINVKK